MKATSEEAFSPKTLTITFDTQEEANEFYTLFNATNVVNALIHIPTGVIRDSMRYWSHSNNCTDLVDKIKRLG